MQNKHKCQYYSKCGFRGKTCSHCIKGGAKIEKPIGAVVSLPGRS